MKLLFIGLCCSLAAWAAGKGKCTDTAVAWEVRPTYVDGTSNNAIQSDGSPYINGQSGVQATIDDCGGTYDAKLGLNSSTRNLFVSFSGQIARTAITPTQVLAGETVGCLQICWLLNVRNLKYVPAASNRDSEFDFTTHLAGGGPLNSHLWMMNSSAQAVPPVTNTAINTPYTDALVHVHHCPAAFTGSSPYCTPGQLEQWFVWPESAVSIGGVPQYVASLVIDAVKRNPGGSGGEYSTPFLFVITALQ